MGKGRKASNRTPYIRDWCEVVGRCELKHGRAEVEEGVPLGKLAPGLILRDRGALAVPVALRNLSSKG